MKVQTYPYDAAEFLSDDETIAEYLNLSLEGGDVQEIATALSAVIRARGGIDRIASENQLEPHSLRQMLEGTNHLPLSTMLKVMHVLGIRLSASKVA